MRYLFEDKDYALDSERRELFRRGDVVRLEPQAFDLLEYLIRNRDRVVSKDDLIASIWDGRIVSEPALTTRINAARCAIGDTGKAQRPIKTMPRKGIRFIGAVREEEAGASDISSQPSTSHLALPAKPSIAVLAFTKISGDPGQDYFSDGSELFVIAGNSSFQYKGRSPDIRQVGRELGVRYVLEGSIRRAGDHVRISAQLIDAVTGAHRWGERYDRELKDVFAVQDEVSRTIVAILVAHVNKAEAERTPCRTIETYLMPMLCWGLSSPASIGTTQLLLHSKKRWRSIQIKLRGLPFRHRPYSRGGFRKSDESYQRLHAARSVLRPLRLLCHGICAPHARTILASLSLLRD